jgi:DNA adenine methylase
MGGKNRIAKDLAKVILETKPEFVAEPFCGALNITSALLEFDDKVIVHCSDAHKDLIDLWKAIQDGSFVPPQTLTKEEWLELKASSISSPLRTFAGYGCSFSGIWFSGFASDKTGRNYCANAANSIKKKTKHINRMVFRHCNYQDIVISDNYIIYNDPPYLGTAKPGDGRMFDHEPFWQWVMNLKNICYTSEYVGQGEVVWSKAVETDMHTKEGNEKRVEKLFKNH